MRPGGGHRALQDLVATARPWRELEPERCLDDLEEMLAIRGRLRAA